MKWLVVILLLVPGMAANAATLTANFDRSRTTCNAPCGVYFDATRGRVDSGFPLTSHSDPAVDEIHDLYYTWDFDDAVADGLTWNYGTYPGVKSQGSDSGGPWTAHVFGADGSGGTFNVQMCVRDITGLQDCTTKTVVVTAANTAFAGRQACVDDSGTPTAGVGGCPAGASALINSSDFDNVMGSATSIACGGQSCLDICFMPGTYTQSADVTLRSGSYTHACTAGTHPVVNYTPLSGVQITTASDSRFMDLDLRQSSGFSGSSSEVFTLAVAANQLIGRVIATSAAASNKLNQGSESSASLANVFIYDSDIEQLSPNQGLGGNLGFLTGTYYAFLGSKVWDSTNSEHGLRFQHVEKMVISNSTIGKQAPDKTALTIRSLSSFQSCGQFCNRDNNSVRIADSKIQTWTNAIGGGIAGAGKPTEDPRGVDFLIERNVLAGRTDGGAGGTKLFGASASTKNVTVRNNVLDMNNFADLRWALVASESGITTNQVSNVKIYNNTVVSRIGAYANSKGQLINWASCYMAAAPSAVRNNLVWTAWPGFILQKNCTAANSGNTVWSGATSPFVSSSPSPDSSNSYDIPNDANGVPDIDDAGTAGLPVFDDFSGGLRVLSGAQDVGAFSDDTGVAPTTACGDGLDNDGDGQTDYPNDPGCTAADDTSEYSSTAECDNGFDDDGDGDVDAAEDQGCTGLTDLSELGTNECDDGSDNDGDGLTDFPADTDCASSAGTDESPAFADCSNGVDDDGDGLVDYSAELGVGDPGCANANDTETGTTECDDGVDSDSDTAIDYPDDPGCTSPDDDDESDPTQLANVQRIRFETCDSLDESAVNGAGITDAFTSVLNSSAFCDNTTAFSGDWSARIEWPKGDDGFPATGVGGTIVFTNAIERGSTVWVRGRVFIPSSEDMSADEFVSMFRLIPYCGGSECTDADARYTETAINYAAPGSSGNADGTGPQTYISTAGTDTLCEEFSVIPRNRWVPFRLKLGVDTLPLASGNGIGLASLWMGGSLYCQDPLAITLAPMPDANVGALRIIGAWPGQTTYPGAAGELWLDEIEITTGDNPGNGVATDPTGTQVRGGYTGSLP